MELMLNGGLITIGIFLVVQLVAVVIWATRIDMKVNALWRKYDEAKWKYDTESKG